MRRTAISQIFFFLGLSFCSTHLVAADIPPRLPVEAFAQLPTISQLQFSPNGKYLAWLSPRNGRNSLLISPLAAPEKVVLIPPPDDLDMRWIHWANDDRILLSLGSEAQRAFFIDKTYETRLVSITADGKRMVNIVKRGRQKRTASHVRRSGERAQIQDNVVDFLPNDPDHILLAINDDQDFETGFMLRRVEVATGDFKPIIRRSWIYNWTTDATHEPRLGTGYRLSFDAQYEVASYYVPGENIWKDISDSPVIKQHTFVDFFEDPRFAHVIDSKLQNNEALYKFDMVDQKIVEPVFSHEEYDIEKILTHPITGRVAGVTYIASDEVVVWFDEELANLQRAVNNVLPNTNNMIVSTTQDMRKLIILAANATDPGLYYYLDRDSGEMSQVAELYKGINPVHMSQVEEVTYTARDGLAIHGYLTLPAGKERSNLPTILLPHGGPWSRNYKTFDYLAQFLANRGYAVLQPNFRGSTGYGRSFQEAGQNQWGLAMQDDLTDAAQWLIDQGITDPSRICIAGASYGGYAALMGAVKTPNLFKCAISINGISDLLELITRDKRTVGSSDWIDMIGDPGGDRAILRETSPKRRIDDIQVPILLIHADDDTRVDIDQAKDMARALQRANKPVELLILKDGGHALVTAGAREATLKAMESFLAQHLGSN